MFLLLVQMYEIWRPPPASNLGREAVQLDIFPGPSGPTKAHVEKLAPWKSLRQRMLEWGLCTQSDVHGCVSLSRPLPAHPRLALDDKSCPVLCLVEELLRLHWSPVSGPVQHRPLEDDKRFDRRQAAYKADYVRCLLVLPRLVAAGVTVRPSGQSAAFYSALLRSPVPAALLPG